MNVDRSMGRPAALARWLLMVAALVFVMVVVGGITRLTESGLSITEWKPVSGAIPPLSAADWEKAFELYRATPEYREINGPAGMNLAAFKVIFFWEWFHRLLGRLVGIAFALPLAWFALKRAIPKSYGWRLLALLLLGGSQGALGWYMVQSGPARLTGLAISAAIILFVQLLLGAWVAGLDAGAIANDWPLMQGKLVPDGIDTARGALFALTHDPYLLHFLHRWWAWVAVAALVVLARRVKPLDRRASIAIHSAFGVQILLGIATVMSGMALWLAASHQAVGALLVAATAWGAHVIGHHRP
jgi:cytochrome c oxidase assembly protein subunit 15